MKFLVVANLRKNLGTLQPFQKLDLESFGKDICCYVTDASTIYDWQGSTSSSS